MPTGTCSSSQTGSGSGSRADGSGPAPSVRQPRVRGEQQLARPAGAQQRPPRHVDHVRVLVADRHPAHLAALPDRHRRCLPDPPQDVERRRVGHRPGPDRDRLDRDERGGGRRVRRRGRLGHVDAGHLRRRRLDRLPDRGGERDGRAGAPVAAAEQPQPHRAVLVDPEQLDVPAVRAQVRPGRLQRPLHPRRPSGRGAGRARSAARTPARRPRACRTVSSAARRLETISTSRSSPAP